MPWVATLLACFLKDGLEIIVGFLSSCLAGFTALSQLCPIRLPVSDLVLLTGQKSIELSRVLDRMPGNCPKSTAQLALVCGQKS